MSFELRFKSIAVRWFVNVFLIVAIAVIVAATAFAVFYSSIYVERVDSLAEDFASSFSALSSSNADTFEDSAIMLADSFEHKSRLEVQVLDSSGKIIVSTTGFEPDKELMERIVGLFDEWC